MKAEKETAFMLFDINMELGAYDKAKGFLDTVKNRVDFDYLIRQSKWMDYKGKLKAAIKYLEKATAIAESSKLRGRISWSYTNLGDYYGHAGRLEESYSMYLKALSLNPNETYPLKKIAWIAFSNDKNTMATRRILEVLKSRNATPDLYLMEMEVADFEHDNKSKEIALNNYLGLVSQDSYGYMYDKYNVILYSEELKDLRKAIAIAEQEVMNRPTPLSYDLLAWAHYNKGNIKKALEISESYVYGKTFEPEVLYHQAEIFKANSKRKYVKKLKSELKESIFELGPAYISKLNRL